MYSELETNNVSGYSFKAYIFNNWFSSILTLCSYFYGFLFLTIENTTNKTHSSITLMCDVAEWLLL